MKKRIISLLLSVTVLLVLLLVTIPAYATETNIFILEPSTKTPSPGGTITYTLSLKNAKAITAFGFNIELPSCLSLVEDSVELNTDPKIFGATLEFVPENGYQVLWYSENGEDFTSTKEVKILEFECTVSEDAQIGSKYEVKLTNVLEAAGSDLQYAEISTEIDAAPHILSIEAAPVGSTVSGTITSYLKNTGDITVQLLAADETVAYSTVVNSYTEVNASKKEYSSAFSIPEVVDGTYTLRVAKANHVARDYEVTVSGGDATQDVKIHLLGDVTGDGKINSLDKKKIYNHINGTPLTGYEFDCGNVRSTDTKINSLDKKLIYNHINGASLWE